MSRLRVVVVDDAELARLRLRRSLGEHPDAEVVAECANRAEAVQAVRTLAPNLVFLDVRMPGGDGFEVLCARSARRRR